MIDDSRVMSSLDNGAIIPIRRTSLADSDAIFGFDVEVLGSVIFVDAIVPHDGHLLLAGAVGSIIGVLGGGGSQDDKGGDDHLRSNKQVN